MHQDPLVIAGRSFSSRLIVGTGKYASHPVMMAAHEASGAEMVTVAVRRVNLGDASQGIAPRLHRHEAVYAAPEHRRMLYRGRRGSHGASRAARRACRTG